MRHGRDEGEQPLSWREAPPAPVVRPLVGRLTAAVRPEAPDERLLEAFRLVKIHLARLATEDGPRTGIHWVDATHDRYGLAAGVVSEVLHRLTHGAPVPAQPQQPIGEAAQARGQEITLATADGTNVDDGLSHL